ncbi:hypothetical protein HQN83_02060 [Pedobacter sp. LMG 31643]|nr:hypothetical protein [Pedobacter foliorum]
MMKEDVNNNHLGDEQPGTAHFYRIITDNLPAIIAYWTAVYAVCLPIRPTFHFSIKQKIKRDGTQIWTVTSPSVSPENTLSDTLKRSYLLYYNKKRNLLNG